MAQIDKTANYAHTISLGIGYLTIAKTDVGVKTHQSDALTVMNDTTLHVQPEASLVEGS